MPDLITIAQVPIARVGTWPAAGGSGVLEVADLQSMVDASNDPEIQAVGPIRGWLGHNGAFDEWGDPVGRNPYDTSEAAIGTIANLAVTEDGQTLLADLVDIPEIVAVLYPQRSIETQGGVVTSDGTRYPCVLTGLAYLGRSDPAVSGMPDLLDAMTAASGAALSGAGVRFDGAPALMSALPRDVDAPADDETTARVTRRALAAAAATDLAPDGGDTPAAAAAPTTEQPMPQSTTPPAENEPPEDQETPETPQGTEGEQDEEEVDGEHVETPDPEGTVTVDAATFAAMQDQLSALTARDQERTQAEHDTARAALLSRGVNTGRFPEARRDHYAALYDADPEGTTTLVEGLAPGLVPTGGQRLSGAAQRLAAEPLDIPNDQPLPPGLALPSTRTRRPGN